MAQQGASGRRSATSSRSCDAAMLRSDYARFVGRSATLAGMVKLMLLRPGFRAIALFRLQEALAGRGLRIFASATHNLNVALSGFDAQIGARIGPGLVVRHPVGIVIGHGAVIGANCTILQGVTVGERRLFHEGEGEYPVIGDGVLLGAGASVLGPVTVGDESNVGAGVVLTSDLPARSVAAPALPMVRPRRGA